MSWVLAGRLLRRVLVTRLRYLGDIAMSTVVLTALHRGDPRLELGYLCEAAHAQLLAGHPLLTKLHALEISRKGADAVARAVPPANKTLPAYGTLAMVQRLRRERYDLAVDLFYNPRSAWLLRMAGVPLRIGGVARGYRKRLYTHLAPSPSGVACPGLYAVAGGGLGEHLSRLAPLQHSDGRPFLTWLQETWSAGGLAPVVPRPQMGVAVLQALRQMLDGDGRYLLLAPAATWASKQWPVEHWRSLILGLLAHGYKTIVLSPPDGSGAYGSLAKAIPIGRGGLLQPLPVAEVLAVVAGAALLVSVDGGIMHSAVAMQVPTIALFGPTNPTLWFPYEQLGSYRVLAMRPPCHPCNQHVCDDFICLPDLSPDNVLATVLALLAGNPLC